METDRDPILTKIVEVLLKCGSPQSIILFGSRARGDFKEKSDYDIVVKGMSAAEYSKSVVALDENDFTLKKIDLLRFESLNPDYQNSVRKEGVILYEK